MVSVSESSKPWRPLTFSIVGTPRANPDLKQYIADVCIPQHLLKQKMSRRSSSNRLGFRFF